MNIYIYAEDLVGMIIGPFHTLAEAEAHIKFCEERGDAAAHKIISEEQRWSEEYRNEPSMSPEKDREYIDKSI